MSTVTELLQPVETDLETLLGDLRSLIGAGHPILQAAQVSEQGFKICLYRLE